MRTITITSGKGGTGKTTVAINLSLALTQMGKRVVLFDADLQLANIDVAMNLQPPYNLHHVVNGEKPLREALYRTAEGLFVMTGGSAIGALMNAGPKRLASFMSQLHTLREETDFLIFDTGAGLDRRVMAFVQQADEVLLVTSPDPTALTDAYATAKIAFRRSPDAELKAVVNMATSERQSAKLAETLSTISEQFLRRPIPYLGQVRADAQMAASVRKRSPLVTQAPDSPAAQDVRALAEALLNGGHPAGRVAA